MEAPLPPPTMLTDGLAGDELPSATRVAEAVVTACIPKFELVRLDTADGVTLSIGDGVEGVDWRELRVGQTVRCEVQADAARVLRAEVVSDPPPGAGSAEPSADAREGLRLFLDTEFAWPPEARVLLSLALVAEDGDAFYCELSPEEVAALPATLVDTFLKEEVLSQFGRVKDAALPRASMADALIAWLNGLGIGELEVVYDYGVDYGFIEQLVEEATVPLQPHLLPTHVGYLLAEPAGIEAAERVWTLLQPSLGLARHHAFVDAVALRDRFEAVHGAG